MDLRIDQRARERLAAALAVIALLAGLVTIAFGRFDSGVRLTMSGDHVVVAEVQSRSIAAQSGLEAGMVVIELHGVRLIQMPQYLDPDPAMPSPEPETGEIPPYTPTIEPKTATRVDLDPGLLAQLLARPATSLVAIQPWDLPATMPDGFGVVGLFDDGLDGIRMSLPSFVFGAALLMLVGWWLASGRAGEALRGLAAPAAIATAVPFLAGPLEASWSLPLMMGSALLTIAAMVPLALALLDRIIDPDDRRLVGYAAAGCVIVAALIGVVASTTQPWYVEGFTRWVLAAAIPLFPGLAAAAPVDHELGSKPAPASRRLLESAEYAVVGATPAVALTSAGSNPPLPLLVWFFLILVAGKFTIRPLARLATRATLQRDLVVAATEAERARVAADIHDDALQELTLLVHRLDAAGDTEGAGIARTVSDRLRAICGDLRLPILDDLGVGPALDWLVLRIERLAGGEVRLERTDGTRPPADVELAFFRVAQEALANAVKHGRPPILVRYATTPGGASLSIDDAGPGIEADVGEGADRDGHFGLLNMQQRAEAIGAILDIRRWPSGGTHVALDWRAH
ncbi:MAG: ATP-binding protein [Candidatus Limnocylindrales bacterium]